jgi:hypothetical protein
MSENAVSGWDVLDSAHRALRSAALGMAPDDGERPTPCDQWTVTQVLQHGADGIAALLHYLGRRPDWTG